MIKRQFLIILLFPVMNLWPQNLDKDILKDVNLNRDKHLDTMFRAFTDSAGLMAYGVPVLLLGLSLLRKDSFTLQKSLYLGASVVTAAIFSNILKYTINRPRPFITYPFIEKLISGGGPSFPSGHASDSFSLATALSITYPKWFVIVPAYGWASIVTYSRMDLGVHYPSDVLAGAIIGAGSAYLCHKVHQRLKKGTNKRVH
jgi:membrane-associated phospholipid phosphatase